MTGAAWTKWFHDDFVGGCRSANLSGEEIGVYAIILSLIASRGGPIEDDRRWIAQMAGVSTRRCNQIMERLLSTPNKLVAMDGRIGNRKMQDVVSERDRKADQTRRAANERWHGQTGELPFDEPLSSEKAEKKRRKNEDKTEINSRKNSKKRQISADHENADASPSVRDRYSEAQNILTPTQPLDTPRSDNFGSGRDGIEDDDRLADPELRRLYAAVSTASGHSPSHPGQIERAVGFVEAWHKDGIDFDVIVLPTIRAVILDGNEPTRTLGRFDARIRHEHARNAATPKGGTYAPPRSPILEPEHEDARFRPLRAALLKRLGAHGYCAYVNLIRFEDAGNCGAGKQVMRVVGPGAPRLMDGDRTAIVLREAAALGWTDVWT